MVIPYVSKEMSSILTLIPFDRKLLHKVKKRSCYRWPHEFNKPCTTLTHQISLLSCLTVALVEIGSPSDSFLECTFHTLQSILYRLPNICQIDCTWVLTKEDQLQASTHPLANARLERQPAKLLYHLVHNRLVLIFEDLLANLSGCLNGNDNFGAACCKRK